MSSAHLRTPGAVRVAEWHFVLYKRFWRMNVLSSFIQPMLYLLGLGVGVGALVDRNTTSGATLGGASYVGFVAPGLLVTSAMAIGAMESMWPVLGGLKWQRGYFGISATPLDATDIVLGHALWMALRCGVATGSVALALALFDDTRSWGLLPGVGVATLVGVAFAMPIMAHSITVEMDGAFAAIDRFLVIPLFLFGGAFYPLSQLPVGVQWAAKAAPLWHGVVVARALTIGSMSWAAGLAHLGYIALFVIGGIGWAVRNLRRKLYT